MNGEIDPLYVWSRKALLDTVEALGVHQGALVLVGAQAVYLHTGRAEIQVAEFTTDADFVIGPDLLADRPLIAGLLAGAGFATREHPGGWLNPDGIYVDLMVPEAVAGPGTRGARLGPHGKRAARRAKGLEAALVDCATRRIPALDPAETRTADLRVAGPAALLVAKTHKIVERSDQADRLRDKDALDVLRLLRAVPTAELSVGIQKLLAQPSSASVTVEAVGAFWTLFGSRESLGVEMAVRSAGLEATSELVAESMPLLVRELRAELES